MTRRRAPLLGLLGANAISIAGNVLTLLAIPWFVLQTTHSATRTGVTAAVGTVPIVLSAAFSGTVADRVGLRLTSIVSDLASAAIVVSVPLLHATVGLRFWQLLVLVFCRGFLTTPGETARSALLPDLVAPAGTTLERAMSGYDAVSRGARMLGAPVAGILIALLGAPNLLLIDAGTFLVSASVVALLVPRPPRRVKERTRYLDDFKAGLRYLRQDRMARSVTVMCMGTNMLDAGLSSVLMPVHAATVLHSPQALGLLVGVMGGSGLAGALAFGAWGQRLPRRVTFLVAFVVCGVPRFAVLAVRAPLPVILVVSAVSGLASGALNPIMDTALLERIPGDLRARVWGVIYAVCTAAVPAGAVLAGFGVARIGLSRALWAFGLTYLLVTLWPAFGDEWNGLERTATPDADLYATMPL
ncbi:MAG TPA: MFS transporter [Mycobacteriales bacterium]|nr:MFS transporter [Mycobacteriales bacterium]